MPVISVEGIGSLFWVEIREAVDELSSTWEYSDVLIVVSIVLLECTKLILLAR